MKEVSLKPGFDIVRKSREACWRIICKVHGRLAFDLGLFMTRRSALIEIQYWREAVEKLDSEFFDRDFDLWYPELIAMMVDGGYFDDRDEEFIAEILQSNFKHKETLAAYSKVDPIGLFEWMGEEALRLREERRG
jgi:hypothetical protein